MWLRNGHPQWERGRGSRCDRQKLEGSLGMITRRVAGQSLASPVDPKTAAIRRDSLAKNLYSTLFDW